MELSYQTPEMRSATNNEEVAKRMFGDDLAFLFRGLVSDLRSSMFLSEMPDDPLVSVDAGEICLNYPLGDSAVLEVKPIGTGAVDEANWGDVHRAKLVRVVEHGKVLA